jgi:hypothetical protein
VTAWREVDGVYVSDSGGNNHWVLLYKIDEEGYPWIFDSYTHEKKKLAKDHNIRRAKRIWLNKKTKPAMRKHISILEDILKALKLMNKTLLDVCKENLGKDASPRDTANDSVGCVDSVTTIMRQVRPETPHMLSTILFNAWLENPVNGYRFVDEMEEYLPEDIIVSPTEGERTGHCGIFMEDGLIASNNSFGINKGWWTQNYVIKTWVDYFSKKQKLPVYIYRKI